MYVLKRAARLAFDDLVKLLAPHEYFPVRKSTSLWKNQTRPTYFTLFVDDFGIKDNSLDDAHNFINTIHTYFKCSVDWEGGKCLGLTLDWNYIKKCVNSSMYGYVAATMHKFQHIKPARPQDAPLPWNRPTRGRKF